MKTVKAIMKGKDFEVGEIKRVDDRTAHNMVGPVWKYVSKSEWKSSRGTKSEPSDEPIEKKPYKKGQKPEKSKK